MEKNKAIIITIGDELLIGQTIDTNSAWMAKKLNEAGIDVVKRIAVGDTKKDIIAALDDAINNASFLFLTGGLGPTADDITKPLLCEYFGGKLLVNDEALNNVRRIFEKRNLPVLERNLKQAEVPDNCIVLQNSRGTAPGMWFEKNERIVVAMPGVPHEMMGIMDKDVLPALTKRVQQEVIIHSNMLTAGLGESFIAERIAGIESSLPDNIRLAYLPGNWIVKLRLTGKGNDKQSLTEEIKKFQIQIADELKDFVIALEDEPFEKLLYNLFTEKNKTLALAESCTGGYIGHTLTQVEGSSAYFYGSMVCYDNEVKHTILSIDEDLVLSEQGVSETIVKQMAEKVRALLKADVGFGITGWLSNSSKQKNEDTGTVWMAVCDEHTTVAKKYYFPYDRIRNKDVALQMAMLMIWKFVNGKES